VEIVRLKAPPFAVRGREGEVFREKGGRERRGSFRSLTRLGKEKGEKCDWSRHF